MGVRSRVFHFAMNSYGYYNVDQTNSIYYHVIDEVLMLNILFETKDQALMFRNYILSYLEPYGYETSPISAKIIDWGIQHLTHKFVDAQLQILSTHYKPQDSDSIQTSPSQMNHSDTTIIGLGSDLIRFQSLEDLRWFGGLSGESCHLIGSSFCSGRLKKYDRSENNRLALTRDFHGFFDGLGGKSIPRLRISVYSFETTRNNEGRFPVTLKIEFKDIDIQLVLARKLKEGSVEIDGNPLLRSATVFVKDYAEFSFCINWKFEQVTEIWAAEDDMTAAID
ncbi:hypothetical protein HK096_004578 [Nowakowskiella sp. JEL0078]|nr:hypothetical protein HK096_004578 [Nowakowskiella sp. JEL0078]